MPSMPADALTQPVLLPNIISFKGFKALAFVGGDHDNVYAVDYDLSRLFWSRHLDAARTRSGGSAACPGGLTTITRATSLAQTGCAAEAAAGRQEAGGAGHPPHPRIRRCQGPGPAPMPVLGGVGARGGNSNVYAIASDGKLHALNPQDGTDMVPPIAFLPPNAKAVGSILIDTVLYAATTDGCGGSPNALWAIELAQDANKVSSWQAKASIAGDGPAFGPDGTIYVATGAGDSAQSGSANSIVALDPKTLTAKSSFSPSSPAPFTSSPIVVVSGGKTLVAAAAKDGKVYLLDEAGALVSSSVAIAGASGQIIGMASWDDGGATLIAAAIKGPIQSSAVAGSPGSDGGVVALKLANENGKPTLSPAWVSRNLVSPLTPLIVNNVVFALASGRSQGPTPAVLYAFDGASGKELWTSGGSITSSVRGVAPSGGDSQVYVVTPDGTLYAFGMPTER